MAWSGHGGGRAAARVAADQPLMSSSGLLRRRCFELSGCPGYPSQVLMVEMHLCCLFVLARSEF